MSDHTASVTQRLIQAGNPRHRSSWSQEDGYYAATCRVAPAEIPQLIEIACRWADPDWPGEAVDLVGDQPEIELLSVTAWRTLADLKCVESIEPLIGMLCELDDFDDWSVEELPHVFGKIGEPAIASLVRLANDSEQQEFVRSVAVNGLHHVAEYHPQCRREVVSQLTEMMSKAADNGIDLNSTVLVALVELDACEAAEAIERAFAANRLDAGMIGDWEYVRKKLGVEGLRLEMPKHPHNSVAQFRTRMGIGIFSEKPFFLEDGRAADVVEAYYRRAEQLFSQSPEAQQVIQLSGQLGWTRSFLEFGVEYLGEVVDAMTLDSVQEFVFDYVPRKMSTEPASAAAIILELTKFWEYVQRVFDLPAAESIVKWLASDGRVEELEADLADPANYGMAKSIFMSGMAAGFDMSSEEGIAEFMDAYNQQVFHPPGHRSAGVPRADATFMSQPRVGRNDPCPCGSGKKFKRCCLRRS